MFVVVFVVIVMMTVIGMLGNALGLTTTVIAAPDTAWNTSVPILNWLNPIGTFAAFIFNWIMGFLQLQFFQAPIPAQVNALIMIPIDFVIGFIIVKLARGIS